MLKRAGHTEATIDLVKAAGLYPAGVLCEIVSEDKQGMARQPELEAFAKKHDLLLISIADLVRYRRRKDKLVRRIAGPARIPTEFGDFTGYVYESVIDGEHHLAIVKGDLAGKSDVLVRVHSECLTGDVLGSLRCDCGPQLHEALRLIADSRHRCRRLPAGPRGPRHRTGPQAARLPPPGAGPRHRRRQPGARACPVDNREYGIGAQILVDLGVTTMRLMTNNPMKYGGLEGFGLDISDRVPLANHANPENIEYLQTKRTRLGHIMEGLDDEL